MLLDEQAISTLRQLGIESFHSPNSVDLPDDTILEPPCSLKWIYPLYSLSMGSFSYAVSGYFYGCEMGRYCSIGESVQLGRQDHPVNWMSTNPIQFLPEPMFQVGDNFLSSEKYHSFRPHIGHHEPKKTRIGNDVWVGHGAYIRAGITIGDGAVIAGHSVVTRDVPPYAIVAGNPAQVKRYRFSDKVIEALLQLRWWRFAIWDLHGLPFNNVDSLLPEIAERIEMISPYSPNAVSIINDGSPRFVTKSER